MEESNKEKIELIKKSFELKRLKKYKDAIELLYKALEYQSSPEDNVEILSQIGDLHISLCNFDRALDEFQRALSINKNHTFSKFKCYEIYYKTGEYNKALAIAQKMCEQEKRPQNYYNYIKVLIKLDKIQDALEIFNSLSEDIKLDSDILYLISTISGEKRKIILEKIISIDESHIDANLDLAEIEIKNGSYNKAVNYCLNIVEDNPKATYFLAIAETKRQNYSRAIELYNKAIALDGGQNDYYFDLAKAYIDISWFEDALSALKKSINLSLGRQNHESLNEKYFLSGWILIKLNSLSKALLNLNLVEVNSSYYSKAQILIQVINLKNKNLAEAKSVLESYLQNEKNNPILLESLAAVYKELKIYKKAIEIYLSAQKIYPNSIYYSLELIDLYIDDKNYDESMKLINALKEKYKNCASIYNSLARIYYRLDDKQKALENLETYLQLDRNAAEGYYFKGLILNDLSKFDEAMECIFTAIKIKPDVAKYYSQMARSYFGLKDFDNALLYSKEAIEINPDEINYKKQAYDIAIAIGDESKVEIYGNILKRSEEIIKLSR